MPSHKKTSYPQTPYREESHVDSCTHPLHLRIVCTVFDHWHDGIVITNAAGTILYANPAFAEMTGIAIQEAVGLPGVVFMRRYLPRRAARVFMAYLRKILTGVEEPSCEVHIGECVYEIQFPKESLAQSIFFFFIRDITLQKKTTAQSLCEQEQATKTLRENEELYKLVAELTSDYIFKGTVDPDGTFHLVDVSTNYSAATGRSLDEVDSVNKWEKIIHPDDWPYFQTMMQNVLIQGKDIRFECRSFTAQGGVRWIRIAARPLFDGKHKRVRIVLGSVKDISERKRSEETQRNTQRLEALGVLAGGIAHDFNNLLGGMFGYLDMAKEAMHAQEPEKARHYLSSALTVYDRTRNLTQQLLTFSKGGVPVKKTMPIDSLLRETVRFSLSGSRVTAEVVIMDNLWPCAVDPNQFSQAVDNIIINARQAMPQGGIIAISAENVFNPAKLPRQIPPGRYVHIAVKDRGIGIPAEYLTRIFDPFFTTKKEGSGLGLATSYSIITKHGGTLEAESVPGKGTTFHIYLPAADTYDKIADEQIHRKHQGTGRVLIMDDEVYIRDVTATMLTQMGYQPESASHGDEAVDKFEKARADGLPYVIVLLDLTVAGGKGGKETIQILRQKGIPFHAIAASGYSDDPVIAEPQKYGFDASIKKPFRMYELEALLNQLTSLSS